MAADAERVLGCKPVRERFHKVMMMSKLNDKSRSPIKPFLISKDASGNVRLTVRETRYNSQNYPLVTSTLQEQTFKTAAAARAHAAQHFNAQPGHFAAK